MHVYTAFLVINVVSILQYGMFVLISEPILMCCASSLSCVLLFVTPWSIAPQTPLSMGILQARILDWVAMPFHGGIQGIFPSQGLNPDLPHCRQILYCLSHQGSPALMCSYYLKFIVYMTHQWLSGEESICQYRNCEFDPWVRKMPLGRKQQCTLVFLPRRSYGWRSLVGYSLWDHKRVR